MKIRIELTKTEVRKLERVIINVSKEMEKVIDGEIAEDYETTIKESFDELLNSSHTSKIGTITAHDSSVENISGEGKIINMNLKIGFVISMLSIAAVFYTAAAAFIIKIKEPVEKFFTKYM